MKRTYKNLVFAKRWTVEPGISYLLGRIEATCESLCETPLQPDVHKSLLQIELKKGAQATTAIEGNTLSDEEIQAVVDGQKLPQSKQYMGQEVKNVIDAMNALLTDVASDGKTQLISTELLQRLHWMVAKELGDHIEAQPGQLATKQRVVGLYRCPDPADVPELLVRFSEWMKREFGFASNRQTFPEAVIQAIVAHLYLEWIHPFDDGNGRVGRLLEFYLLLRAGLPDIASTILTDYYNQTRPEYYRQIDKAGRSGDLTEFLSYALQGFADGLKEKQATVLDAQFKVAWQSLIFERFAAVKITQKEVFTRRRALALAMPIDHALTSEEVAVVTPSLARKYRGLSNRTVLRDISALLELGLIRQVDGPRYITSSELLRRHMPRRLKSA